MLFDVYIFLPTLGSDTMYYRFWYHRTGSDTAGRYVILFAMLKDYKTIAAVWDKTCCVTSFQIVFYWALFMKNCANPAVYFTTFNRNIAVAATQQRCGIKTPAIVLLCDVRTRRGGVGWDVPTLYWNCGHDFNHFGNETITQLYTAKHIDPVR